jgi:alpha-tubulin suppressor-like RCC1 family protein
MGKIASLVVAALTACGGDDADPVADGGPGASDPCEEGAIDCDANATCSVSGGEPACLCNDGYTGDGLTCQPDECALGTDDCDPAATCTDRPDGFDCACPDAFVGDGTVCTGMYSSVEAGAGHACVIRVDGTLWCWGANASGQVGNGDTQMVVSPAQVGIEADWIAVSAGGDHTCGIRDPGTLWCWGEGYAGRLGNDVSGSTIPLQVGQAEDWVAVAAGGAHTCGIRADRTLRCWGGNDSGQLGTQGYSTHEPQLVAPTGFDGDDLWTAVTAGGRHTCAIRTDRMLFCWGSNQFLQLGIGSLPSPDQNRPRAVGFNFLEVAAGGIHTCAVRDVGLGDAELRCWGSDARGQVGGHDDPESDLQGTPRAVGEVDWAHVTAGGETTCGLKMDGSRWCWGRNDLGQLGDETQTDRPAPAVASGAGWVAVSAGGDFMCGLDGEQFVSCWGANHSHNGFGALGDGLARDWLNELEPVDDGGDWIDLASGVMTCGLRTGGSLWCWGTPGTGGIGDGEEVWRASPTRIGEDVWDQVSIKWSVACGLRAGELYCWGWSYDGLLGGEGEITVTSPQRVGDANDWLSIAVGESSACGIRGPERSLWCWGRPPGVDLATAPVQVAAGQTTADGWTAVSPRGSSVCGIRAGRLYCWGAITGPDSVEPVQIGTASDWTHVAAFGSQACAIRAGRLHCWGQYFNDEEPAPEPQPRQVGSLADWLVVELGGPLGGCGVRAGGALMCWTGGSFPAPTERVPDQTWRPVLALGVGGMSVVNAEGQRWFLGEAMRMGDGTMWRSSPALIAD